MNTSEETKTPEIGIPAAAALGDDKSFKAQFWNFWHSLPFKKTGFGLLLAWAALFHLVGNSTLGYIKTHSLFGWMNFVYSTNPDDEHGYLIPLVVVGLLWWKRERLMALEKKPSFLPLALVALALGLHVVGFVVQQTRISIVAFFVGVYGITGLVWGLGWLRATFFPMFLFAFCVPLGTLAETITLPLRVLATTITSGFCSEVLGIGLIQDGTRIFDSKGTFQYEVAAACSGLRSLTAILAITTIFAFMNFKTWWRCALMVALGFPLAIVANVFRLTTIILAAEAFGQEAGNYVHESSFLSLLPYIPAIIGVVIAAKLLREKTVEPALNPA